MDLAGVERKLKIQELEQLRLEAYDNSWTYKERTKAYHDKHILRNEFQVGNKVLLFKSRLQWFPGILRSRWKGPFYTINIFPNGVIELQGTTNGRTFKVNGHRLKIFHDGAMQTVLEQEKLNNPIYPT
ncbi:uncharacterized protein LOC141834046 [Curcuma longa]|uniref:uncharacterized protein LOC141834046 n=1 Tax=Curcuma longa TaxID=136217 RepID=UPI003D9E1C73